MIAAFLLLLPIGVIFLQIFRSVTLHFIGQTFAVFLIISMLIYYILNFNPRPRGKRAAGCRFEVDWARQNS
jgi:hypothetical protein